MNVAPPHRVNIVLGLKLGPGLTQHGVGFR
jgi:hypothetical protein